MLGIIIAIVAVICSLPFALIALFSPKKGGAPEMKGLPIVGSLMDFIHSPLDLVKKGHSTLGDCFTVNIFHKKMTFLVGPAAHQIFFKPSDKVLDQAKVYKFNVPVFGPGVVFDVGLETRMQQFAFIQKGLKPHLMKTYVNQMVQEAEAYFATWGDSGEINLRDKFSELIILTASRCLMGEEVREKLYAEVARLYHDLDEGMQPISVFFPYLPIEAHRRRDRARLAMVKLFSGVLDARRKRMAAGEEMPDDFINTLMTAKYENGSSLTDEEITGMLIALLFGGQHTSAITSTWTALLIHNEKGMKIPEDHILVVSPAVAHKLDNVYTEPEKYDPERFAEPRMEDKKNGPFAFISFGGGRHTCLGEHFGYLQIKTILAVLLQNFELELTNGLPQPDFGAMIVGPATSGVRYKRIPKRF